MSQRGYTVVFVLVLLAAFAGAFFGGRFVLERITGRPPGGEPTRPTADLRTPALVAQATLVPTRGAGPAAVPAGGSPTVRPAPTLRGILTPFVPPSPTLEPTATPQPTPLATATDAGATPVPTPTSTPSFAFGLARAVRNTSGDCPGVLILGQVFDRNGNPLAGVRLRLSDEYGAQNDVKISKSEPADLGKYDFPLFGPPRRYYLLVEDANGRPLSEKLEIPHGVGPDPNASCHWVDWRQR